MNQGKCPETIISSMSIIIQRNNISTVFISGILSMRRSEGYYLQNIISIYSLVTKLQGIHLNNICWPTEQGTPKTC